MSLGPWTLARGPGPDPAQGLAQVHRSARHKLPNLIATKSKGATGVPLVLLVFALLMHRSARWCDIGVETSCPQVSAFGLGRRDVKRDTR